MSEIAMEKIVSLCKRRGFIFQHDEIYGGLASVWDYGPYGSLMKRNIKSEFIKNFVQKRDDVVLIDSAVLTKEKVLEASGHIGNFTDPLVECKNCHKRFRADQLNISQKRDGGGVKRMKFELDGKEINRCVSGSNHDFTKPKQFNLMFKTKAGAAQGGEEVVYLRPETAQGMFVNFKNVLDSTRMKIPFGIAQIGRSFRNEITTGNFSFRAREFEIAEIEYFVKPGDDGRWFQDWLSQWERFIFSLGVHEDHLRQRRHKTDELSHYSKATVDLEYDYPFGRKELAGVANRTDFDLKAHQKSSGILQEYFDQADGKKYLPYVIEPTLGVDRLFLALICDAFRSYPQGRAHSTLDDKAVPGQKGEANEELVLHLDPKVAPIEVAVLPLSRKSELVNPAKKIAETLRENFVLEYDDSGSIGKRYRRQDEIGTPLCVTFDFNSLEDQKVTVRNRDTMEQDRVAVKDLAGYLQKELELW